MDEMSTGKRHVSTEGNDGFWAQHSLIGFSLIVINLKCLVVFPLAMVNVSEATGAIFCVNGPLGNKWCFCPEAELRTVST